ncbi:MAG: excinuclease ABC subunit UvrC [Clostridia bacterium]|nr:excinuclease ABC subunit UvrC [Clostridia bacterium]
MKQENRQASLLEKARLLPEKPGVYRMYSEGGVLLYVGKSKALKNRVSSYFQNGDKNPKTARLVAQIADFSTILTETEEEALLLENELIKLHRPKYNILLKDDKNYPYLYLPIESEFPRPELRRKRAEKDTGLYFGPYSSANAVHEIIRAASTLFLLPRCKRRFPEEIGRGRPCLYHDMGRCMGLCSGKISAEEYRRVIDELILFLRHDHKELLARLEEKMLALSEELRFEAAAQVRDSIRALSRLTEKQHVLADPQTSADVYALYPDEVLPLVSRLVVRRGRLIDAVHFPFLPTQIVTPESFTSLLYDHYRLTDDLPKKILFSEELYDPEGDLLDELLHHRAGHKVERLCPKRGKHAALVTLARENAKKECLHRKEKNVRDRGTLHTLAELLSLPDAPRRVEAYDISNHGNDSIYGGMVVALDAKPRRSLYRSFSITQTLKDDYAAMVEVILRRLSHLGEEGWEKPDLILLDGGMTHVSVVKKALADHGFSPEDIPVFGMVKDEHHKPRTLVSETDEISIAKETAVFGFVYSLQEEVHRFSLAGMDRNRRKRLLSSTLTEIPGIGEKKQKALLKRFQSIKRLRAASDDEILAVKGIGARDLAALRTYFHEH